MYGIHRKFKLLDTSHKILTYDININSIYFHHINDSVQKFQHNYAAVIKFY